MPESLPWGGGGAWVVSRVRWGSFYTNEAVNLLKISRFHFWNRADPVN